MSGVRTKPKHTSIQPGKYYSVQQKEHYIDQREAEERFAAQEEEKKDALSELSKSPEQIKVDTNFEEFIDRQTKLAFEEGNQRQALKSLQAALN